MARAVRKPKAALPAPVEAPQPPAAAEDGAAEFRAALRAATGTADKRLQSTLLNEVFASLGTPCDAEEKASRCGAALAMMAAFQPRDAVEAMLAGQAVALNGAGMAALRRASDPGIPPEIGSRLRRDAANAFRAVVEMAAAIEARRGGGTHQRVTVEHVTVQAGGQAVVGAVASGIPAVRGRGAHERDAGPHDARPRSRGPYTPHRAEASRGEPAEERQPRRRPLDGAAVPRAHAPRRRAVPGARDAERQTGKRTRCFHHGGASTGPKTAAGLARIAAANTKHGGRSGAVMGLLRQLRETRARAEALVAQLAAAQWDAKARATAAPGNPNQNEDTP